MKKLILFLAFLLIGFFLFRPFFQNAAGPRPVSPVAKEQTPSQTPTPKTQELPTRLKIEKLNVDAEVEYVGLDAKGNMDVPKGVMNVAWYNLGFHPGDVGSAVMAGHFDDPNGDPAVFYDLRKLKAGDKIEVQTESGKTQTYVVEKTATYPFDGFPLQEVFNTTDKPRLNLITCDGVFDKSQSTYLKRFVVYAVKG